MNERRRDARVARYQLSPENAFVAVCEPAILHCFESTYGPCVVVSVQGYLSRTYQLFSSIVTVRTSAAVSSLHAYYTEA